MRIAPHIVGLLFLILLIPEKSHAQKKQDTLFLNLAEIDPGANKTVQGNRSYSYIIVENSLTHGNYSLEILNEGELLPVLEFKPGNLPDVKSRSDCDGLISTVQELERYQENENQDPGAERRLNTLVQNVSRELSKGECTKEEVKDVARQWMESTKRKYDEKIKVRSGEKVTILISRDTLKWTFVFLGNQRGKWLTTYGFGFTPKSWEKDTYYSKQELDTSLYRILKYNKPNCLDLNYIPAIFFSYFPSQKFSKGWNNSLTAGLGFDLSAPTVFIGYSGTFWHNLGLSCGLAFQQQYSLKPQYSENGLISEYLELDQLHDKVYRPTMFLSITFRFGENPFPSNVKSTTKE